MVYLVERESLSEVLDDQFAEFGRAKDRSPTGPAQDPVDDFVESINPEPESNATIPVSLNLLRGVPIGLNHELGSVGREMDLDVVLRLAPIDRPGITEVGLEVEITGNHRRVIECPESLEPGDAISPRVLGIPRASDQIPCLFDQAEAVGMEH